jgi:hypothetical protein
MKRLRHLAAFAITVSASSFPALVASSSETAASFAADDPRSWPFLPDTDTFSPDALFDLRSLNESTAGEHGFVSVSPEGDFLRGDGQPLRFWAVNFEPRIPLDDDQLAYAARFLAKRGVNLVRWHGFINPKVPGSDAFHQPPVGPDDPLPTALPPLEELDHRERDFSWRLVAAMRREGIYLSLSPYWAVNFRHAHRFGLPAGVSDDRDAQGLLFFDPRMRAAYKQWLRDWLLPPNPYTGIPLARDPAVAIIHFQNEDSLLFWTVDFLSPEARARLSRRFGDWLRARHGSLDTARRHWGPAAADPADNGSDGAPALLKLDHYRSAPSPELARRLADQLEFYATVMRDTNADLARFLREELGIRAVLNANNWRTANGVRLLDAERWSYLAADALASNRYYTPPHLGRDNGWAVEPGHRYASISALHRPQAIPLAIRQVAGRPMLVTESTWVMPTLYRAEAPLAVAAYLGLTGIDSFDWFSFHYADWTQPTFVNGRYQGSFKWTSQTPDLLGLFPAAALLHRRGDVRRGAPVVEETRPLADIWTGQPPALIEEPGYDPNRDPADAPPASGSSRLSPLAYLVGPVHVRYTDDPAKSEIKTADLSPWIDRDRGIVRSNTNEIELDYRRGLLRLDTPRAQGAAGFFSASHAHRVTTTDLRLDVRNAYAHVLAVSLDAEPLAASRNLLVQIGTVLRPTGWRTEPARLRSRGVEIAGETIVDLGGPPWRIEKAAGTLTLRNPHIRRATVCDINARPLRDLPLTRDGDTLTIDLPPDALYVVLR